MTLSKTQAGQLLELVRDVARVEIMPRFRRLDATQVRSKSSDHDLVTEADLAAEAAIAAGVEAILPGARVIGEEAATGDPSLLDKLTQPGTTVVVDPVDGTWNFAKGLAVFGVILAVVQDGRTVWGLLYDPVLDDWIWAVEGQGAWYERPGSAPHRLSVAQPVSAETASGFVPLELFTGDYKARVAQVALQLGRTNALRCSCHEYRLLAQGHVDFILCGSLNPWDHAAGILIAQEAGGCAGLLAGGAYRPVMLPGGAVVASNTELLTTLTDCFAPLD